MKGKATAAVLVTLAMLTAACASDEPSARNAGTVRSRPASTAKLTILEPKPGQVVEGTTLVVRLGIEGARVLEQASTNVAPDTGHLHLALDGKVVTLLAGLEYRLTDLTPGEHLLQAEFAAADHGPFNPRVITTVTFTVR